MAELVTVLRDAMTPAGMLLWFETPRAELGGLSPIDVLDESPAAIATERLVQSAAVPAVGTCAIAPG